MPPDVGAEELAPRQTQAKAEGQDDGQSSLPRQETTLVTETSDGKRLVLSRALLESYVQERIKYDRLRIFSCLTVQLRRELEAQLKQAQERNTGLPGVSGLEKKYKLEIRHSCGFLNITPAHNGEGGAVSQTNSIPSVGKSLAKNTYMKNRYYLERQKGQGFEGASIMDARGAPLEIVVTDSEGVLQSDLGELKLEVCLLAGNFTATDWTTEEFDAKEHKPTGGGGELVRGNKFSMHRGRIMLPDTFFILKSSYMYNPGTYCLGVRCLNKPGIKEAKSEPFQVHSRRSQRDEKVNVRSDDLSHVNIRETPVKVIPRIGQVARQRLAGMNIQTVFDFIQEMQRNEQKLKKTLRIGNRQWEEVKFYCNKLVIKESPPLVWFKDDTRRQGMIFDHECHPTFLIVDGRLSSLLQGRLDPQTSALCQVVQEAAYGDYMKEGRPNWYRIPDGTSLPEAINRQLEPAGAQPSEKGNASGEPAMELNPALSARGSFGLDAEADPNLAVLTNESETPTSGDTPILPFLDLLDQNNFDLSEALKSWPIEPDGGDEHSHALANSVRQASLQAMETFLQHSQISRQYSQQVMAGIQQTKQQLGALKQRTTENLVQQVSTLGHITAAAPSNGVASIGGPSIGVIGGPSLQGSQATMSVLEPRSGGGCPAQTVETLGLATTSQAGQSTIQNVRSSVLSSLRLTEAVEKSKQDQPQYQQQQHIFHGPTPTGEPAGSHGMQRAGAPHPLSEDATLSTRQSSTQQLDTFLRVQTLTATNWHVFQGKYNRASARGLDGRGVAAEGNCKRPRTQ
mmetsp:Transcript_7708/g.28413  ORF Transcript_7708/g.28413 Transcript_7708/m.28413 type:complete len:795 (+) Transcript_7708:141-2525(+)